MIRDIDPNSEFALSASMEEASDALIEKLRRDKLQLKIALYWIRGKSANSCVGECECPAVFAIADQALRNPSRTEVLSKAPHWVKERFPEYYERTTDSK